MFLPQIQPNEFKIINVDVIESSRHINFTFDVKPINKTATIISFDANIEPGISFDQVFVRFRYKKLFAIYINITI